MIGILDMGGGVRGAYGAGVLDYCLDRHIIFDYCVGVSAGAGNLVTYVARQRGRNIRFYVKYQFRKQYMGFRNKLKTGNFVNLEYIYGTLTNSDGEDPLDYDAFMSSETDMCSVATDALTGKPVYFYKKDCERDDYGMIKASSCMPIANRPYEFCGKLLFDGALSDAIPLEHAFSDGCDRVVVILTKPRDFYRDPKDDAFFAKLLKPQYPQAARKLAGRALLYNLQLDLCKHYEKQGKVCIVAPDDIGGIKTLSKDRDAEFRLYYKGYKDAEAIDKFIARD